MITYVDIAVIKTMYAVQKHLKFLLFFLSNRHTSSAPIEGNVTMSARVRTADGWFLEGELVQVLHHVRG